MCEFWINAEFGCDLNRVFGSLWAFPVLMSKLRNPTGAVPAAMIIIAALNRTFTVSQSLFQAFYITDGLNLTTTLTGKIFHFQRDVDG